MSRSAVVKRLSKLSSGVAHYNPLRGKTGKLDGSGAVIDDISIGLNAPKIWVRLGEDRGAMAVNNARVSNLANLPVITAIRRDTDEREVIDINLDPAIAMYGGAATHAGTLASLLEVLAQAANTVYAGPTSGADSAPIFRVLTFADIPLWPIIVTEVLTIPANTQNVVGSYTIGSGGEVTINGKQTIV